MPVFTSSSLAVSVTGLSDSTANFTADSLNSVVYDFVFFADIWTHLNGLQYYPCLCVRRTITTSDEKACKKWTDEQKTRMKTGHSEKVLAELEPYGNGKAVKEANKSEDDWLLGQQRLAIAS